MHALCYVGFFHHRMNNTPALHHSQSAQDPVPIYALRENLRTYSSITHSQSAFVGTAERGIEMAMDVRTLGIVLLVTFDRLSRAYAMVLTWWRYVMVSPYHTIL